MQGLPLPWPCSCSEILFRGPHEARVLHYAHETCIHSLALLFWDRTLCAERSLRPGKEHVSRYFTIIRYSLNFDAVMLLDFFRYTLRCIYCGHCWYGHHAFFSLVSVSHSTDVRCAYIVLVHMAHGTWTFVFCPFRAEPSHSRGHMQ